MVCKRPFISDTGEESAVHIHCSSLPGGRASAGSQSSLSKYSCTQKMVLKSLFVRDTGETLVHSFWSASRQSISWEAKHYELVELYLIDGLEKAVFGDHVKATLHIPY